MVAQYCQYSSPNFSLSRRSSLRTPRWTAAPTNGNVAKTHPDPAATPIPSWSRAHPTYMGLRLTAYGPLVTRLCGRLSSVLPAAFNDWAIMRLPAPTIDHPVDRRRFNLHGLSCSSANPAAIPARLASGIGTFRSTAVSFAFV
ncbi:hypothetical protein EV652_105494 [Kribbella steppae]|uniref:Uncharacterized protein n=1 Tax=Kribbella steppae TaxID=2512223 RepID=A0A4R2HLH4_9ACTN|nr:hypothetical protein EV652_105494 [Kribbella steppae]